MSFPASLALITLTGEFLEGEDGTPREGVGTVTLPTPIRSEGDNVIIPPFGVDFELVDGQLLVELPATTDPQWLPNTAVYIVQITFDDFSKLWWSVALPYDTAGGTLDLADVGAPNVGTPSATVLQGITISGGDGSYKGTWGSGTSYRAGDTVQHGSAVYGALRASAGITPGTDATAWKVYPGSSGGAVEWGAITGTLADQTDLVAALGAKADTAALTAHTGNFANPHAVTKAQVGLSAVDNTSDAGKPVSTAQQTALDAKAPLASPALTGTATAVNLTLSGRQLNTPVVLAPGVTVTVDASLGNNFTLTAGQNFTLANPTNPVHDQKIMFAIRQDGVGSRVMTLGSAYRLGDDITSVVLSTAVNTTDYLGCRYNGADSTWDVIAFVKGYN
jgi:hypothetical protein